MEETTLHRFTSEVKYFLGQLIEAPLQAQPSKYLKERGFDKTRLIRLLLRRGVLERHENILFPDKTGNKYPEYSVKYSVKRKNFDRIMHRIFSKYFEKNEPTMINECDCGGCCGGDSCGDGDFLGGATNCQNSGQYVGKFGELQRRKIYTMPEKKSKINPNNILGKTIQAESKKQPKKIKFTQKQLQYILETDCAGVGNMSYDSPKAISLKKDDESLKRYSGFSCETL